MSFAARFIDPEGKPPTKLYVHEAGLREVFGSIIDAQDYVSDVLKIYSCMVRDRVLNPADYIIGVAWGKIERSGEKIRIAELFGYYDTEPWSDSNPDIYSWVFKNGVYRPEERNIICGDGTIMLGEEEKHRRRCKDMQEFMQSYPDLGYLEPAILVNSIES